VAAFVLFRHIIEMCDSADVLLSESCGTGAIPVVRAQFEASLALSYLFEAEAEYRQRALCWFCCYLHDAIMRRETLAPGTQQGQAHLDVYERRFEHATRDRTPNSVLATEVAALRGLLNGPQLAPIESEYQRASGRRRFPEWFALFDGPRNRAELAR
jgi:hypothetical protein